MDAGISAQDLREILAYVAEKIRSAESNLNSLDSAIGDGDHGITMRIGFDAIHKRISELDDGARIETILNEAGMAFLNAAGGAIGVILAKMLMAGGAALKDCDRIGPSEFSVLLAEMQSSAAQTGKAKPGDKTILDAVYAASEAARLSEESNENLSNLVSKCADSAERAAQETSGLVCRVGRASRLGDRARGHADPGATSFGVIMRAFSTWIGQKEIAGGIPER